MEEMIYIPLAALQHYAYCPRQCALIHIEQAWEENYWTAQGRVLHERVDSGTTETRGDVRAERGVEVISHKLRINGKLDLLEIRSKKPQKYYPVEYKRGKPKIHDWDKIQLCGQALCLEEMLNTEISEAALWYWEERSREIVSLDDSLREQTLQVIKQTHELFASQKTPPAKYDKKL
jgi:CRISPR-associated exonuclease Cas4